MKDFFVRLEEKIAVTLQEELSGILSQTGAEPVYAVALITDSDCVTLRLSANTLSYLKQHDEEANRKDVRKSIIKSLEGKLTEEDIEAYKDLPPDSTRWMFDDWGYHGDERDGRGLTEISRLLFQKHAALPGEEHTAWKSLFFETALGAFSRAICSGVFRGAHDASFFIAEIDSDDEMLLASAKALNPPERLESILESYNWMTKEQRELMERVYRAIEED